MTPDLEGERRNGETQDPLNAAIRRLIEREEGETVTALYRYKCIKNLIAMTDHWVRQRHKRIWSRPGFPGGGTVKP
jgi:hypothetical protein